MERPHGNVAVLRHIQRVALVHGVGADQHFPIGQTAHAVHGLRLGPHPIGARIAFSVHDAISFAIEPIAIAFYFGYKRQFDPAVIFIIIICKQANSRATV